ncbi:MAG: FliO/MopB family protein [Planctomycetaceae bacterium]|nr:FliO/MopB family protein [Planctomycetaceae bacterium]
MRLGEKTFGRLFFFTGKRYFYQAGMQYGICLVLVLASACCAQGQNAPYSKSNLFGKTQSAEGLQSPANHSGSYIPETSGSGVIVPATYQQVGGSVPGVVNTGNVSQGLDDKNKSTGITRRPALPLRRPGEKVRGNSKGDGEGGRRLGSTSQQLGTTTIVLGGIIVVILVVSKLVKKHTPIGSMNLSSAVLEVLGRKMLDQKHAIHYVYCGNRILVLGSSLEGLRTLAEITDPVEIDRIRGECKPIPTETSIRSSFSFLLSKTERETEKVDLDKQHRERQKKQGSTRRTRADNNQPPAPDLANFGLTIDQVREIQS